MELIRIAKRALKYKSPCDEYVEKMIREKLEELNVLNKDKIIKKLEETYDEVILVTSHILLKEDETGISLMKYLNLDSEPHN